MPEPKIITASLEGTQIASDGETCHLHEYDFSANRWLPKDEAPWPLPRARAEEWLTGWNAVDRFAAINILTEPVEDLDTAPERASGSRSVFGLPMSPK